MKQGLIFANARAKAKEQGLFTTERLHRMIEAKNLDEAVRILIEVNYAGGLVVESNNFYELLKEEERLVNDFVRAVAPEKIGFECFFMRNDYHNIKSLLKAKYGKIENIQDLILPDGNMRFAELKSMAENECLDFNPYIKNACNVIEKAYEEGKGSPRLIDTEIDKAMYKDISEKLDKDSDKYVKQYFIALIDTANIATFVRTVKIKSTFGFFESNFIEGGSLKISFFKEFNMDVSRLCEKLSMSPYKDFTENLIKGDISVFETMQDDYLLDIFSLNKSDMFSVAPIIGYYLAKLNEIKVLRVVLVCKKNQVPSSEMKKRVRKLYA